jgi:molybdopterin converting factor small subunit
MSDDKNNHKYSRIRVRLFANLREMVGKSEITLHVANPITVGYLRKKIYEVYPLLSSANVPFVVAINLKVALDDDINLTHLDEISLLPPVSGG